MKIMTKSQIMKRALQTIFICIGIIGTSNFVNAEGYDIGVIDPSQILYESSAGKFLIQEFEKDKKSITEDHQKREKNLIEDEKKLEKKRDILSKEAFEKERKDFEKKVIEFRQHAEQKKSEINQKYSKGQNEIFETAKSVISDIAKEKKMKLVLPTTSISFMEDGLSITDEVMQRLNKKLDKVSFK